MTTHEPSSDPTSDSTRAGAARLQGLDTCALSDALDALGLTGALCSLRPLTGDHRISGRVVTVRLVPADSGATPSSRHLCTAAVAASGSGDVVVVAHPGGPMAGWGGLLSRAASQRGIEGTIVDGGCRDIDESRELDYPLFGRGATPITARGRIVEAEWGGPVEIDGVTVRPGDLVLADGSGVVFVPADRAGDVLDKAHELADREAAMSAAVDRGDPITEVMGATYERLTEDR